MRKKSLQKITEFALDDHKYIFIGSDLSPGIMEELQRNRPDQFYMEGVSEQHIIGMAAGLALEGYIPYINTIATFLTRRCFEQIAIDICLQNLKVRLVGNGGGMVYAPLGPTHQAVDDVGLLNLLPNMKIVSACDAEELSSIMDQTKDIDGPIYYRLAKGGDPIITNSNDIIKFGKGRFFSEPQKKGSIVSTGVCTQICQDTVSSLKLKNINIGHCHFHTINPLNTDDVLKIYDNSDRILIVEEHIGQNGLHTSFINKILSKYNKLEKEVFHIHIKDYFNHEYGSQNEHMIKNGISKDNLENIFL